MYVSICEINMFKPKIQPESLYKPISFMCASSECSCESARAFTARQCGECQNLVAPVVLSRALYPLTNTCSSRSDMTENTLTGA